MTPPARASTARAFACRVPAAAKLVGLAATGSALLLMRAPVALTVAAAAGVTVSLAALGPRRLWDAAWPGAAATIALAAGFTLAFEGTHAAWTVLLRLVTLLALAHLVIGTTRASDIQDALVAALRPFERLPFVSAERAGLALSIALRSLSRLQEAAEEIREAQAARGLRARPHLFVVALLARILRDAEETADAIEARGWSASAGASDEHA